MFIFAGVGVLLSAFTTVLLIFMGVFGVLLGVVVIAVCWIPICLMVAVQARWNETAAWIVGGLAAAGMVAAIVTGMVSDPIGGNLLTLTGLATFFWARYERRKAKRRAVLAAIVRQRAAQEARREARAARVERWTSLLRKRA